MKKRERIEKLEEMIMELAARLECQRRRTDEAMARIAELEREVAEMRKAAPVSDGVLDSDWAPCTQPGVADVDWRCNRCGRIIPAGARHICDGTWWYSDIAGAAYEGEDR